MELSKALTLFDMNTKADVHRTKDSTMSRSMTRAEAIEVLSIRDLANLTPADRAEQLETMMGEVWETDPGWSTLLPDIQQLFVEGTEIDDPSDSRFDPVLLIWLRTKYVGAQNDYLLDLIQTFHPDIENIEGTPEELQACPCCGCRTLGQRGYYEICSVCWWEDSGQDNETSEWQGGPNHMSLTRGRANFLKHGICEPNGGALRQLPEPSEKYAKGRIFVLEESGEYVIEPATGWRGRATDEER